MTKNEIELQQRALIIGGTGFIGSSIAFALVAEGWNVRILDIVDNGRFKDSDIEIISGSINNADVIRRALKDVTTVFYFASHSMPSANPNFLSNEIDISLKCLDLVLSKMVEMNIKRIVFPSSGGTIYGDINEGRAKEDNRLVPLSSYGAGKLLSEEIVKFYSRVHGIRYLVIRIANVYGCPFERKISQGAIDIFIQNILSNRPINIWGGAEETVRDYIFIDDLCSAIIRLVKEVYSESQVYNIGTGHGHTLREIICTIEEIMDKQADVKIEKAKGFGIKRNVLDVSKILREVRWQPQYTLYEGIKETLRRKREYTKKQIFKN